MGLMDRNLEAWFQKRLLGDLHAKQLTYRIAATEQRFRPDMITFAPSGEVIGLELKRSSKDLRSLLALTNDGQIHQLCELTSSGHCGLVASMCSDKRYNRCSDMVHFAIVHANDWTYLTPEVPKYRYKYYVLPYYDFFKTLTSTERLSRVITQ